MTGALVSSGTSDRSSGLLESSVFAAPGALAEPGVVVDGVGVVVGVVAGAVVDGLVTPGTDGMIEGGELGSSVGSFVGVEDSVVLGVGVGVGVLHFITMGMHSASA